MNASVLCPDNNAEYGCRYRNGTYYLLERYHFPENGLDLGRQDLELWSNFGLSFAFFGGMLVLNLVLYLVPLPSFIKSKFRDWRGGWFSVIASPITSNTETEFLAVTVAVMGSVFLAWRFQSWSTGSAPTSFFGWALGSPYRIGTDCRPNWVAPVGWRRHIVLRGGGEEVPFLVSVARYCTSTCTTANVCTSK